MTSQTFVIAALAVGCMLFHGSAAAVVASPVSLNLTDHQWQQIFAQAQGGNATDVRALADGMLAKINDVTDLAEDNWETLLELAVENMVRLVQEKLTLTEQELLKTNRTTPLTLEDVKQVVTINLGAANDAVGAHISRLGGVDTALAN